MHYSQSEEVVAAGVAYHSTLRMVASPWSSPENAHLAELHFVHADTLTAQGAPLDVRLEAWQQALADAPASLPVAQGLARVLYDTAVTRQGDEQEQMLRSSLSYFAKYAEWAPNDPATRRMLEANYSRFPFLAGDLDALRQKLWGTKP
jgi:hypothetical protein